MGKGKQPQKKELDLNKGKVDAVVKVQAQECRHILVEKQALALQLSKQIDEGGITFNECARLNSIDKAGRSGLLGWKTKAELDPQFWEAALTVKEGD